MAEVINMPKLGFDMQEGQLINWVKKVGDTVGKGDVLAEIESDKATIEVESFSEGTLLQHLVSEGDWVPIGAPIAVVGAGGESVDLAALGVAASAPAASAQTEAAKPEAAPAPAAVSVSGSAAGNGGSAPAPVSAPAGGGNGHGFPAGVRSSPLARKVATDLGVDIARVPGSGPQGRVTRSDVETFKDQVGALPSAAPAAGGAIRPIAVPTYEGDEALPLTRLRARIADRMLTAKLTAPHFYVTTEIAMDAAVDLRNEINNRLDTEGVKVSMNDLIVKAVALALREYPNLNASFNGDHIVRHKAINVGIAVAIEGGLMNVVSKDADKASLAGMAVSHKEMIGRAREGKVKPEDVEGETFAVSNLGPYDVEDFIAIINPPAAAIVAVGSAKRVPVVNEAGEIVPGWRMKATISADHRVTDGAEAARYMQRVKQILEDPLRLLM